MNHFQLFKTLRKHNALSERRNPAWEQNKTAKYFMRFFVGLMMLYLMFLAVAFSFIVNDSESTTGYEFMYGIIPFLLVVDFLFRFAFQQTPSQLIKPYALLPLSRYACVDCFLISSMLSSANLIWFGMFLPFAIMSVVFSEGIMVMLGFLFGLYLLFVTNSQWYILVRSLINTSMLWWLLPIAAYALLFSPWFISSSPGIDKLCDFYAQAGEGFSFWNPVYYVGILLFSAVLFVINRRVQHTLVWNELGKTEKAEKAITLQLTQLNRLGEVGEYMKLEIKSVMRNKNLRKTFITGTLIIVLFSSLLSFTDIYDNHYMTNFWCIYCFALFGAFFLTKIMCYEGNYIDGLMVHKENIISLLRAKYYLHCTLLLLPFLLMLPTVFTGKCTLLMLVAYAVFTAGAEYFLFFQMAVYNKQTMPLNTKFIGKGSMENSYLQVVIQLVIFIFPIFYISVLKLFLQPEAAYTVILLTGLAFMATHRLWIRNIYNRMMCRRYANLEGLRASR